MSLYDIFEAERKHYHHNYRRDDHYSYVNNHHDRPRYYPPDIKHYAGYVLGKIWTNRKLRILMMISVVFIIALIILVLILIIPLLGGVIDLIRQEGLKGIYDSVLGFLDKLWKGN